MCHSGTVSPSLSGCYPIAGRIGLDREGDGARVTRWMAGVARLFEGWRDISFMRDDGGKNVQVGASSLISEAFF